MEIKLNKERVNSTAGYKGSIRLVIYKLMYGFVRGKRSIHSAIYSVTTKLHGQIYCVTLLCYNNLKIFGSLYRTAASNFCRNVLLIMGYFVVRLLGFVKARLYLLPTSSLFVVFSPVLLYSLSIQWISWRNRHCTGYFSKCTTGYQTSNVFRPTLQGHPPRTNCRKHVLKSKD